MSTGGIEAVLGKHAQWLFLIAAVLPFGIFGWKSSKTTAIGLMILMVPVTIGIIFLLSIYYSCIIGFGCV
jgi:hypothetical protein